MAVTQARKAEVIKNFEKSPKDTGSTRVQVALITDRVNDLQNHFSKNQKDHHSRRGLLKLVGRRRRLLEYLRRTNITEYRQLIEQLGLRK